MTAGSLKRRARSLLAFLRYVAGRFQTDRASSMAASLSYTSLLALVPLMAIALAMLAAFPVFDDVRNQLQSWVFQNFVPAIGEVVQKQVGRFIANAGKLTAAGIVGLAFTAIMLLVTIEDALNVVFRVARERKAMSKLLVYWTVLTLGPLLIGLTFSLQTYLTAASRWAVGKSGTAMLTAPLPTLLSALAFTVLFATVPNRRVQLKDAIIGGFAAALLFAVLRYGFGLYVISSGAYTNVYGAVAAVPIFLFWMFLSWMAVLIGAEITAALPEWRAGYHQADRKARGARRLTLALEVLSILGEAAREGGGVPRRDLLERTAVAERDLLPVLRRLIETDFVAPTSGRRYLLARDLAGATLGNLIQALELDLALDDSVATCSAWRPAVESRIAAAHAAAGDALGVSLSDTLFATRNES
ncbi:MAG TPA: YihY family inner membrane protein [Candidatus Omnitrophota bacterium]|nr:YihY family inner membrane protein [Candidatus Omnitrophota bacterium]